MSLNSINLNNGIISQLYGDVLVQTTVENNHATPVPEPSALKYLGKNSKHIVILVEQEAVPFLPDPSLAFLTNILSACKLSLADVAIVNIQDWDPVDTEERIAFLEPKHVIMFGFAPPRIDLPIDFPPFQLQRFQNRIYMHAPTLEVLEKDKSAKLQLWNALKTMFGI